MDSGSGSMQSSSGGDEEYDSRGSSISALLSSGVLRQPTQPSTTSHHLNPATPSFFDSLPSYLDAFQSTPASSNIPSVLDPNIPLVGRSQQERNCTRLGGPTGTSPTPPPSMTNPLNHTGPSRPFPSGPYPTAPSTSASSTAPPDQQSGPSQPRASKKRPRASRRAPTTVLTTDTTNFRQMVQEFTGFPAQPFLSSSISSAGFQRSRLDFFNAAAASAMRSGPGAAEPSFLLQSFSQKLPAVPPFGSFAASPPSSSSPAAAMAISAHPPSNTTTASGSCGTSPVRAIAPPARDNNNTGGANPSSATNYQLHRTPNMLNIHNPLLSFQSLLQSAPQSQPFNLGIPAFATRPPAPPMMPVASSGPLDNLGNQMGTLSSMFASDAMATRGGGSGGADGGRVGSDMPEWGDDDGANNAGSYGDSPGVNGF